MHACRLDALYVDSKQSNHKSSLARPQKLLLLMNESEEKIDENVSVARKIENLNVTNNQFSDLVRKEGDN